MKLRCTKRAAAQTAPERAAPGSRREELIEAAEQVFLDKGYHNATMNDVAKAAGMSKKTVYTLVSSKIELFESLIAHHQAQLHVPDPAPGATLRDRLVDQLLGIARFVIMPQQVAIFRLIMAEYTHSPDLCRTFIRGRVSKAKTRLEECLAELSDSHPGLGEDPKELAAMLFGMAVGEFHLGILIGIRGTPTRAALEARVRDAVDLFLAGVEMRERHALS